MNGMARQSCRQNTSLNCSHHDEQNPFSIPVIALALLIGILALLFNSGVFILIVKKKKIRLNPYHFLVLILCVSDLVVGLGTTFAVLRSFIPAFRMSKGVQIFTILLRTTGLYLSIYHTFLISLQRFLVICNEKLNSYIFSQNRKHFVCFGGSIAIVISICIFISPSTNEFDTPVNGNTLSFVYEGHYKAYTICMKFLTLFLLSSTVILYLVTIAYVHRTYMKISPVGASNNLHVIKTIGIQTTEPRPSENVCASSSVQDQVNASSVRSRVEHSNQMDTLRRKKVVSTLQLVGLLITVLVICTGPLTVTLLWFDTFSVRLKGILFGLFCINSMLNPIIYVWKLVDIREIVKSALCCFNR